MKWDVFHFLFKIRIFFGKIKNKTRQSKTTRRGSTFSVFFKWFTMTWNVIGDAIVQNADRFKNPFVLVAAGDCPAKHGDVYNRLKKIKIKWKLTVKLQDDFMFFRLAKMNQHDKNSNPRPWRKKHLGQYFQFQRKGNQSLNVSEDNENDYVKKRERESCCDNQQTGRGGWNDATHSTDSDGVNVRLWWPTELYTQPAGRRWFNTQLCTKKKRGGGRDIFFILVGYVATSQDVCPFAFPRVKKKKRKGKRERERYGMSIVGGPFLRRWILSHSHWRIESRNNISTLLLLDCFLFATFLTFPKRGRVAIIG